MRIIHILNYSRTTLHIQLYRDFLNYIYHKKRALYVAYIAQYLSSDVFTEYIQKNSIHIVYFKGDLHKPMLQFLPTASLDKKLEVSIRLYFAVNIY